MAAAAVRACKGLARRFPVEGHQLFDLYEADRGIDAGTGGSVSSWRSQGHAARHLAQATGTKKPTFQRHNDYNSDGRVSFDGGDVMTHSAGVLDGRSTCGVILIVQSAAANTNKYVYSEPDVNAGTNGVDMHLQADERINFHAKTDTALATLACAPGAGYAADDPATVEATVDLNRSGQEVSATASRFGWSYATVAGSVIDADAATISVGDFSDGGFSAPATANVLLLAVMGTGLSAGQRRRFYRYAFRKYATRLPYEKWHDGTFGYVL